MTPTPADRPVAHLAKATELHGRIMWDRLHEFHAGKHQPDLPTWPDWCYVPVAATLAAVTRGEGLKRFQARPLAERTAAAREASILAGLAAWRQSKGVFVFDPDLAAALLDTPLTGDLPTELLFRLPAWCVFIAPTSVTPGAFTWLEWDAHTGRPELRFLLDDPAGLQSRAVHLGGSLADGVAAAVQQSMLNAGEALPGSVVDAAVTSTAARLRPLVNLVLYLCSAEPDYGGRTPPGNAQPRRVKGGERVFPPDGATVLPVGARIGAALRAAHEQARAGDRDVTEAGRARPVTHVRAAHWHLFWTGPRVGPRVPVVKWIAPTLVNAPEVDAELPAVVRRVRE